MGFHHLNCFYSGSFNKVSNSLKILQKYIVCVIKKAGGPRRVKLFLSKKKGKEIIEPKRIQVYYNVVSHKVN